MLRLLLAALLALSVHATDVAASPRGKQATKQRVAKPKAAKPKVGLRPAARSAAKTRLFSKGGKVASLHETLAAQNRAGKRLRLPPLSMKPATAKELKYLLKPIPAVQVDAIKKVVTKLKADSPTDVIVFRGQAELTKTVSARAMRGSSTKTALADYQKAAEGEHLEVKRYVDNVDRNPHAPTSEKTRADHMRTLTPPEALALRHQRGFGGEYFVSTTRNLAAAYGEFHMAPQIRYIYVMQVPKGQAINIYGLVREKTKALNLPAQANQQEKELAIPLDATPYVRAIYDTATGKFLPAPKR